MQLCCSFACLMIPENYRSTKEIMVRSMLTARKERLDSLADEIASRRFVRAGPLSFCYVGKHVTKILKFQLHYIINSTCILRDLTKVNVKCTFNFCLAYFFLPTRQNHGHKRMTHSQPRIHQPRPCVKLETRIFSQNGV